MVRVKYFKFTYNLVIFIVVQHDFARSSKTNSGENNRKQLKRPVHMSPVDRASSVVCSYENSIPVNPDEKDGEAPA